MSSERVEKEKEEIIQVNGKNFIEAYINMYDIVTASFIETEHNNGTISDEKYFKFGLMMQAFKMLTAQIIRDTLYCLCYDKDIEEFGKKIAREFLKENTNA